MVDDQKLLYEKRWLRAYLKVECVMVQDGHLGMLAVNILHDAAPLHPHVLQLVQLQPGLVVVLQHPVHPGLQLYLHGKVAKSPVTMRATKNDLTEIGMRPDTYSKRRSTLPLAP